MKSIWEGFGKRLQEDTYWFLKSMKFSDFKKITNTA